jgi:hypothetical protein
MGQRSRSVVSVKLSALVEIQIQAIQSTGAAINAQTGGMKNPPTAAATSASSARA